MLVIATSIVFGIYILGAFSDTIAKANELIFLLTDHFKCEALGHVPGKCSREPFERLISPYVLIVAHILLGLAPLSILNFVFKWSSIKKAKEKLTAIFSKHKSSPMDNEKN